MPSKEAVHTPEGKSNQAIIYGDCKINLFPYLPGLLYYLNIIISIGVCAHMSQIYHPQKDQQVSPKTCAAA